MKLQKTQNCQSHLEGKSPNFPFKFFILPLVSTGIAISGSCDVKQQPIIVSNKSTEDKAFITD